MTAGTAYCIDCGSAAATDAHAMTAVLHWEALSGAMADAFLPLTPNNRYWLDLPSVTLQRPPKDWLVDLVVAAGTLARELANALDIQECHDLIGQDTLLDRLDDALRVAQRIPFARGRRELRAFDPPAAHRQLAPRRRHHRRSRRLAVAPRTGAHRYAMITGAKPKITRNEPGPLWCRSGISGKSGPTTATTFMAVVLSRSI